MIERKQKMSNKVFLVDLEIVQSRYTGQWKDYVPKLLRKNGIEVHVIEGPDDIPPATSPGAFLNFGGTNIYKAAQVSEMGRLFVENKVNDGDYFLFTDAWHPGIINLKYMSELLGIKIKIGGLWHAGNYDPADFLGRLIGDAPWVRHAEKSFFYALDHNYFATSFHIDMFTENLLENAPVVLQSLHDKKIVLTGWPMDYMPTTLAPYKNLPKRDLILFPHRIAPEKQVEIFRDLATRLPQYEFVVCQDTPLTKHEYHTLLGEAKMVFSCSLQETLGIGCYEGAIVGAIPFVPDRLSYTEMYFDNFKYPSEWTENWDSYQENVQKLAFDITKHMVNYQSRIKLIEQQAENLTENFFSANILIKTIKLS